MFEVVSESVKDRDRLPDRTAGRAHSNAKLRVTVAACPIAALVPGKQQNLRALTVDSSGHLMRKYRLTYDGNRSHPKRKG
ncbi:hypothetical protein QUB68_05915 [Microcoleus sp. A006_D1]|uniref:hypothetical protein n=1 Tax=Microcoleus sp. A006_D1 TaxID=3055267 RepID=UPI002FD378E9